MEAQELYSALKRLQLDVVTTESTAGTHLRVSARRYHGKLERVTLYQGVAYWDGGPHRINPVNGDPDSPQDVAHTVLNALMFVRSEFKTST